MPKKKVQRSTDEILDRRAQSAWEYRQRRRAAVKIAPSAVQAEYDRRAQRSREAYLSLTTPDLANHRRRGQSLDVNKKKQAKKLKKNRDQPQKKSAKAAEADAKITDRMDEIRPTAVAKPVKHPGPVLKVLPLLPSPMDYDEPMRTRAPESLPPPTRSALAQFRPVLAARAPTPTFQDLAGSDSESSISGTDNPHDWDADDSDSELEDERRRISRSRCDDDEEGPLLNETGRADYVPEPGQQPYYRSGRKYWF
ncbi:hypothetical protein B0H12DRAFT_1078308 [Mycena haematopus]|nr:hypothetical protein B0H12DRAFT_1078308 [Mycena haematopus]